MSTFTEASYPRRRDGRFQVKAVSEADGGTDALGAPGALGDVVDPAGEPINGLVARQEPDGTWALHHAATNEPVIPASQRRRRIPHYTRDEAELWARQAYPLLAKVRSRLEGTYPQAVRRPGRCPRCGEQLDQEVAGGARDASYVTSTCPKCTYNRGEAPAA
ncbi:hypothetical protein [Isoptericola croceus]|uniref:hypothetical protein n=1 Tax=Isoptericola croceus TaxID=3031406 RepID=UPI0023FA258F|nr:hypothetical protein [Isoptericola croceus]